MNDSSKAGVLKNDRMSTEVLLNGDSGKPFEPADCRYTPPTHGRIEFNGFVLDFQRGCLLHGIQEVVLRPKAYDVLSHLATNNGRLVSKDELMKAVWPNVIVTDDSLFQCITELRRALQDDGQRVIKTVQRRGYRFEAVPLPKPGASSISEVGVTHSSATEADSPRESASPSAQRTRILVMCGAVAVLITVAATLIIQWKGGGSQASEAPISLVVLPFRNLSNDPHWDAFAVGLTVELTSELSTLPESVVISSATAHALKDQWIDIRQIGHDLNVRYVLQGTVTRSEADVRINVQLIEAATGRHIWADRQVREVERMASWQDEVVAGIASALNFKLTRLENERVLRKGARNPEAHDLAIRGWALVYTAKSPENYQSALALFKEALVRDSKAVSALAGIGWVSALSVLNGWSKSPEDDVAAARRAADQLLAIDPNHVVAHHVRGICLRFEKNTIAAQDSFLKAISVNSNFANSHAQLGATHMELGNPEQAVRSIEKALRLSPRDPNIGHWMASMGIAHMHLEHYPEAVTWLRRSFDVPTSSPTLIHRAYLVGAHALTGRANDASAALQTLLSIKPDATVSTFRHISRSTNPEFLVQRERLYEGLRRAGLPE